MSDLSRPSFWVSAFLAGTLAGGCVPGSELRPSQAQAKSGPPARGGRPSAGALLLTPPAGPAASDHERPPATGVGQRWVRGYWHWNGVRYVYVPGRFERAPSR